jgi:ComF family protein
MNIAKDSIASLQNDERIMINKHTIINNKNNMNKILKTILDFIFPIECINCEQENDFLCSTCFDKIEPRELMQCPLCNKQQINDKLCTGCKSGSALDEIIICANYDNEILQNVIHYFKYKNIRDMQTALGQIMINKLSTLPNDLIIIPTPLHRRRKLERGFNQSALLANMIGEHFNLPVVNNVLWRKKNIQHQAELNKKQRLKNIANCFGIKNTKLIKNKNILLIDDVITTGATLNEQARLLKKNNARCIWALVIAKN